MSDITPREGEEVLMHLRKSIFVLGRQMLVFGLAVIASGLLLTLLYKYPIASVVAVILLVLSLFYAFYYFIVWFYDAITITNIRVLVFNRKNLFHAEFTEANYTDITSITYKVKGVLPTLFQYGVVVLNLGTGDSLELVNVSTPAVVQETLKNLVDATANKKYH